MQQLPFAHPYLTSEQAKRWEEISQSWHDKRVVCCTAAAGKLILLYLSLQRFRQEDFSQVGKSLFLWDCHTPDLLYLLVQEEREVAVEPIDLLNNCHLQHRGVTVANPQQLLDSLMVANHRMYSRLAIDPEGSLGRVIAMTFDDNCSLLYPPEFPPLLFHIAVANGDCATALQILDHPFIHAVNDDSNWRLMHLLNEAVQIAVSEEQLPLLEELITRYRLGSDLAPSGAPNTLLIALRSGRDELVSRVLALYSPQRLLSDSPALLTYTIEQGTLDTLAWALDQLPAELVLPPDQIPWLLALTFCRFGHSAFQQVADKWKLPIDWLQLMDVFTASNIDPRSYLQLAEEAHFTVASLPPKELVRLLLCGAKADDPNGCLLEILRRLPDSQSTIDSALLEAIADGKLVDLLLAHGAMVTESHFERLFTTVTSAELRLELFNKLCAGIATSSAAKRVLPIASAFGDEALQSVFRRFPSLKSDHEFLAATVQHITHGAALLSKTLLQHVARGDLQCIATAPLEKSALQALPHSLTEASHLPTMGKNVAIDMLVDVLIPRGQFEQIETILLQRPDLCYDFWFNLLFSGAVDYSDPHWEKLASHTLPLISPTAYYQLLIEAFRFGDSFLAAFLLRIVGPWQPAFVACCFRELVGDHAADFVDLLDKEGWLSATDNQGNSLLHIGAEENNLFSMEALLPHVELRELRNGKGETALDISAARGALTLSCQLYSGDFIELAAEQLISRSAVDLQHLLVKTILNSSTVDVKRLIIALRNKCKDIENSSAILTVLDKVTNFIATAATMIVRFALRNSQSDVFRGYGKNYKSYEEQQWEWGWLCEGIYQQVYGQFQNEKLSALELLTRFAEPHSHKKGYSNWRMGFIVRNAVLITHFTQRYFFFWHIAQRTYRKLVADPEAMRGELQLSNRGYQILYNDGKEIIPLTHISLQKPFSKGTFAAHMDHCTISSIKLALPIFSHRFDELVTAISDAQGELPREKIAFLFWLGCHITLSERGNSQYMLMLHRLMYNMFGWRPAPWSQRYVQPDCVALLLPFDIFYNRYYEQLFDEPPVRM
jgi:hypothetical protein